ncbi:MAG: UbiA-like polyprenyltransferase [Candidatus Melainabacteria bacterium]|jgi:4-hydroxybenzoate polyprenyltransferase
MNKLISKIKIWAEMIKLEHTIFSAPFMLSSMLLASTNGFPPLNVFFWSGIALLGARSAAMSLNRLIDAQIDSLNPRTASRAIPSGQLTSFGVLNMSILGFAIMGLASLYLPRLCLILFPVAVIWLSFYSFTKRFTYLCHLVLGIALGGAALGGWIAVAGQISWVPILLGLAVAFWVCGFDILYALQDLEYDREQRLHSIPAKFGFAKSLWISRICHVISLGFFIATGFIFEASANLTLAYQIGTGILGIGLLIEHWIIYKDFKKIELAFFTANAFISTLFFLCLLIGKLLG